MEIGRCMDDMEDAVGFTMVLLDIFHEFCAMMVL